MDFTVVLFFFVLLLVPAVVILLPVVLRSWERRRMLDAAMAAADKGQALPAALIESLLASNRRAPELPVHVRDLRRGVLLLAITGGFALLGLGLYAMLASIGSEEAVVTGTSVALVGAVPGMIGVAYLVLARLGRGTA